MSRPLARLWAGAGVRILTSHFTPKPRTTAPLQGFGPDSHRTTTALTESEGGLGELPPIHGPAPYGGGAAHLGGFYGRTAICERLHRGALQSHVPDSRLGLAKLPHAASPGGGPFVFYMLGRNEFALRKSPPTAPIFRAIRRAPLRGVLVRHYTSICSITKASMMSPSLISLYFSMPVPHTPQNFRFCGDSKDFNARAK